MLTFWECRVAMIRTLRNEFGTAWQLESNYRLDWRMSSAQRLVIIRGIERWNDLFRDNAAVEQQHDAMDLFLGDAITNNLRLAWHCLQAMDGGMSVVALRSLTWKEKKKKNGQIGLELEQIWVTTGMLQFFLWNFPKSFSCNYSKSAARISPDFFAVVYFIISSVSYCNTVTNPRHCFNIYSWRF